MKSKDKAIVIIGLILAIIYTLATGHTSWSEFFAVILVLLIL